MRTPEQDDAVARVRAEVTLFMGRYTRRLKTRAAEIAVELMSVNPEENPDEVGRRAVAQAGRELKLLTRAAQTALLAQDD